MARAGRSGRGAALAAAAFAGLLASQFTIPFVGRAAAQEARPPFLYLSEERILTASRAGAALLEQEAAARDALRAEARQIEAAFEDEERQLTDQRATMPPEEFRKLADAFDGRVVEARRQQDERAAQLAQEFDQKRRQFYADVGPVLVKLMERLGAVAILDEKSVLLADQSINITDQVIAEIDRAAAAPEGTATPAPQTAAPAAPEPGLPATPGAAPATGPATLPESGIAPGAGSGPPAARPAERRTDGRIFRPEPRPGMMAPENLAPENLAPAPGAPQTVAPHVVAPIAE